MGYSCGFTEGIKVYGNLLCGEVMNVKFLGMYRSHIYSCLAVLFFVANGELNMFCHVINVEMVILYLLY